MDDYTNFCHIQTRNFGDLNDWFYGTKDKLKVHKVDASLSINDQIFSNIKIPINFEYVKWELTVPAEKIKSNPVYIQFTIKEMCINRIKPFNILKLKDITDVTITYEFNMEIED